MVHTPSVPFVLEDCFKTIKTSMMIQSFANGWQAEIAFPHSWVQKLGIARNAWTFSHALQFASVSWRNRCDWTGQLQYRAWTAPARPQSPQLQLPIPCPLYGVGSRGGHGHGIVPVCLNMRSINAACMKLTDACLSRLLVHSTSTALPCNWITHARLVPLCA